MASNMAAPVDASGTRTLALQELWPCTYIRVQGRVATGNLWLRSQPQGCAVLWNSWQEAIRIVSSGFSQFTLSSSSILCLFSSSSLASLTLLKGYLVVNGYCEDSRILPSWRQPVRARVYS